MSESDPHKPVAVVTGANRGIGFEICRGLAQRDVLVILTSRNADDGKQASERLRSIRLDVRYHQLDVTDSRSIQKLFDFLSQEYSRLDILVNNAGISIDNRANIFEAGMETIRKTMDTNVYGPLQLTQVLISLMKKNGYGRIVNVSSGMGQLASLRRDYPAYRLSKASLNALTLMMAAELKSSGILVNAMCPGWVRTEMGGASAPRSVKEGADTAIWLSTLPKGGPQGGFFRDQQRIPW